MKEEIRIQTYRPGDLPALADLINAADAHDKLERGTTPQQLEHEFTWPGYQAETDCFLAWAGDRLVGYGDFFLRLGENGLPHHFYIWGVVHPEWRRRGLGRALLEKTYERALERLPEVGEGAVYFQSGSHESEAGRRALYEGFGMSTVRYYVNLARPVNNGLPRVQVPAGYRLRPFDPASDLEASWRVDVAAFGDHWGFTGFPLEEYRHWLQSPAFRPDLSYLAVEEATGSPVALALNRVDPDWIAQTGRQEGLVNTLGVLREHRHRGLGSALLAQSLHALRSAGMEHAHLWADAENLTGAVRIYERAGFARRKTTIAYRRVIREA